MGKSERKHVEKRRIRTSHGSHEFVPANHKLLVLAGSERRRSLYLGITLRDIPVQIVCAYDILPIPYGINPRGVFLKGIHRKLVCGIRSEQQHESHRNRQSDYVYRAVQFVSPQKPEKSLHNLFVFNITYSFLMESTGFFDTALWLCKVTTPTVIASRAA